MNIFDLSLRHILVFNSVAETLSMSKSAQKLYITQSAVSQTIKDIENKFGTKLFIRKGNNLHLTQEGMDFHIYTKRIINLLEDAQLCLENFSTLHKGCIHIGASSTIGNYLLPELIKTFKNKYPNINVTVFIGNTRQVLHKLKLCDVGIALIEGMPRISDSHVKITKFMRDEIIFICSSKNALADRKVDVNELENEIFINREKGSGTRQIIEMEMEKLGVHLNASYEFNNSEAVKNAVLCNIGISALSRLIVKKEMEIGTIKRINIGNIKIGRWFYLLETSGHNKAQKAFIKHILEYIRE